MRQARPRAPARNVAGRPRSPAGRQDGDRLVCAGIHRDVRRHQAGRDRAACRTRRRRSMRPLRDALLMAAGADNDWPEAVEVLNETGRSNIVLLCEHASNHMPAEYARLGLDAHHLRRHIAWDIGAAELTRRLSARLDAPAFLATY